MFSKVFDIPLLMVGTTFQQSVWNGLIQIPCHRIIGSNGDKVGYAGGLPVKKSLLDLESNLFT